MYVWQWFLSEGIQGYMKKLSWNTLGQLFILFLRVFDGTKKSFFHRWQRHWQDWSHTQQTQCVGAWWCSLVKQKLRDYTKALSTALVACTKTREYSLSTREPSPTCLEECAAHLCLLCMTRCKRSQGTWSIKWPTLIQHSYHQPPLKVFTFIAIIIFVWVFCTLSLW